jgi:hypothetical protein
MEKNQMKSKKTPTAKLSEIRLLDEALQETFPASDPIACTPASRATKPRWET